MFRPIEFRGPERPNIEAMYNLLIRLVNSEKFRKVAIYGAIAGSAAALGALVWQWGWLSGGESGNTPNETLRNLGLVIAGVIAFPIAIWRAIVADRQSRASLRQAKIADEGFLFDRYQRGAEMLGSETLSVRLAGIYSLEQLAKDDPEQYHIQIVMSFCSFVTNPPRNREPSELPSGRAANAEQAIGQD